MSLVVGGGIIFYKDNPGSTASSMLETKLFLNSIIYDAQQGAILMSCDLRDFVLSTPMLQPELKKHPH